MLTPETPPASASFDPSPLSRSPKMRVALASFAWGAALLCAGLSIWGLLGDAHWSAEVMADYRWHLGWLCALAAGMASAVRSWGASAILFGLALGHLRVELALSLPTREVFAANATLRVATVTAGWEEGSGGALLDWMDREQPDLALVGRLDAELLAAFEARADGRLVQLRPAREGWDLETLGSGLWCRNGFDVRSAELASGLHDVRLVAEGRELRVIGLRAPVVTGPESARQRRELIQRAGELAAEQTEVVVLAELNATSYSSAYRDLRRVGDLRDTRQGFGRQATWTSDVTPFGFVLAADHVFMGSAFACVSREHDDDVQSDHHPVLAELVWSEGPIER